MHCLSSWAGRGLALAACVSAAACGSSSTTTPTAAVTTALSSVTFSSTSVIGGVTVTGTVQLTAAAPTEGVTVALSSSNAVAMVPANVIVPAGSTSQTFSITTVNAQPPATITATITATYLGVNQNAALTVATRNLVLLSVSFSTNAAVGGTPVTGTITLSTIAPAEGVSVSMVSSSPAATVPAIVTVPAGATTQTFNVGIIGAPAATTATITASYAGASQAGTLTIAPTLGLQSLSLSLGSVPGGLTSLGLVTLTAAAPGSGTSVLLASNSPDATVPASVTVPAGATSQTFPIATLNAPPTTTATITATYAGVSQAVPLTIVAYPVVTTLSCSNINPTGGTSVDCNGTLASPAPSAGWSLALISNNSAATVPDHVTVPPAGSTFHFTVATQTVTVATSVVIDVADAASGLVLFSDALNITP